MARISNIKDFLGGASNVQALEILRGEQRTITGTCNITTTNTEGVVTKTPQDISNWEITAKTRYTTALVTPTGSGVAGSGVNVTNFAESDVDGQIDELDISITDGPGGQFAYTIPKELWSEPIAIDATTVPVVALYINIANGPAPLSGQTDTRTIRQFRTIIIIREGRLV